MRWTCQKPTRLHRLAASASPLRNKPMCLLKYLFKRYLFKGIIFKMSFKMGYRPSRCPLASAVQLSPTQVRRIDRGASTMRRGRSHSGEKQVNAILAALRNSAIQAAFSLGGVESFRKARTYPYILTHLKRHVKFPHML